MTDTVDNPAGETAESPVDTAESTVDTGILGDAGRMLNHAVAIRRRIHAHPETGLELPRTQGLILDELESIGVTGSTGVVLPAIAREVQCYISDGTNWFLN